MFLLGGTGFIGSALTKQLLADRAESELMMLIHRSAPFRDLEQVDTCIGSLERFDLDLLDRFRPEVILHLARMRGRGRIGRYLAAWRGARANRRVIRHLRQHFPTTRTVYVSGTLVYGDCGVASVDEGTPINPTAFAREYINAERPWMKALDDGVLPVAILRPPWIIGPSSWFAGYYLDSIKRERVVPLFGDGRNLMSLLHVEDCAGLIAHAAKVARTGSYYNLFTPGVCCTQREFAETVAAIAGVPVRRFSIADLERKHGAAAAQAFSFSCRASTRHPELLASYQFKFPSLTEMVRRHVSAEMWV